MTSHPALAPDQLVPATLRQPGALRFWIAVALTGIATGLATAILTGLLGFVQSVMWPAAGSGLLGAAAQASPARHLLVLTGAGVLTGLTMAALVQPGSGNGIDLTAAIWFRAGRMPALRTLGTAVLSIVIVGMGTSLGREGAPKQAGAVFANLLCDRARLSDEQRELLVACGAGAGMAAAYGVPLGGALFAVEVLRGVLALRLVLPAVVTSLIATWIARLAVPDAPVYHIPAYDGTFSLVIWAAVAGPVIAWASALYVQLIAFVSRHKPKGRKRYVLPVLALGLLGLVSIPFPQLLGNGKDVAQQAFDGSLAPWLLLILLMLKPAATALCLGSGAPGGLFTPSLSMGALLGGSLGVAWSWISPGIPLGVFSVIGAAAVLAATTQGPLSAVILMMELTGEDRSYAVPLLIAVAAATLVARTIEPRSIYDAKLGEAELRQRLANREAWRPRLNTPPGVVDPLPRAGAPQSAERTENQE